MRRFGDDDSTESQRLRQIGVPPISSTTRGPYGFNPRVPGGLSERINLQFDRRGITVKQTESPQASLCHDLNLVNVTSDLAVRRRHEVLLPTYSTAPFSRLSIPPKTPVLRIDQSRGKIDDGSATCFQMGEEILGLRSKQNDPSDELGLVRVVGGCAKAPADFAHCIRNSCRAASGMDQ